MRIDEQEILLDINHRVNNRESFKKSHLIRTGKSNRVKLICCDQFFDRTASAFGEQLNRKAPRTRIDRNEFAFGDLALQNGQTTESTELSSQPGGQQQGRLAASYSASRESPQPELVS